MIADLDEALSRFPRGKRGLKLFLILLLILLIRSLPSREAWIEISGPAPPALLVRSLPSREAWIEIRRFG